MILIEMLRGYRGQRGQVTVLAAHEEPLSASEPPAARRAPARRAPAPAPAPGRRVIVDPADEGLLVRLAAAQRNRPHQADEMHRPTPRRTA